MGNNRVLIVVFEVQLTIPWSHEIWFSLSEKKSFLLQNFTAPFLKIFNKIFIFYLFYFPCTSLFSFAALWIPQGRGLRENAVSSEAPGCGPPIVLAGTGGCVDHIALLCIYRTAFRTRPRALRADVFVSHLPALCAMLDKCLLFCYERKLAGCSTVKIQLKHQPRVRSNQKQRLGQSVEKFVFHWIHLVCSQKHMFISLNFPKAWWPLGRIRQLLWIKKDS